jgi:hypothetical protein
MIGREMTLLERLLYQTPGQPKAALELEAAAEIDRLTAALAECRRDLARTEAVARALLARGQAVAGWQPIETAPKHTMVILYHPKEIENRHGVKRQTHSEWIRIGYLGETPNRPPTHWMSLPKPPQEDGR